MYAGSMRTTADFQLDFVLDSKAEVTQDGDGALYIEGYASDFGLDRQDEAFEDGAFQKSMDAFMAGNPVLLYHHKMDQALGRVMEYKHKPDGMWIKARVDPAEPGTFLADVVKKIARGTIKGFSVGGRFHRHSTPTGPRIHTADIMEISVTPMPVNPRTLFAVVGKAFGDDTDQAELDAMGTALTDLKAEFDRLEKLADA